MTTDHSERGHATFSGSSAHIWVPCPASRQLLAGMPAEEPKEAAKKGTVAHESLEILLTDFLQNKRSGSDPLIRAHLLSKDEDISAAANDAVKAVWELGLKCSITGKAYGVEDLLTIDESLSMWGFVDFWAAYRDIKAKRVGYIFDFKSGAYYVDVNKNAQLAFYAVGLRCEVRREDKDLDYVRAAIFQPLTEPAYRETEFTSKELDTWEKKFKEAAKKTFAGKAKFKVGEHCEWCRAKAICSKHIKTVEKESALEVTNRTLPVLPPEELTDEQVARILLNRDRIDRLIKDCYSYAILRTQNGAPIKGIKVVEGTAGRRKWSENKDFIAKELISLGVKDPLEYNLKTLGVIEKELTKVLGGKEFAKDCLGHFTTRSQPTLTIVGEDDKRESIEGAVSLLRSDPLTPL